MKDLEVRIEKLKETFIYGTYGKTNDKSISQDIKSLSNKFHDITKTKEGEVLPFFVLSKNYDPNSGNSELFIGGTIENPELTKIDLPEAEYAVITIKPKFGFLWGLAVGQAKQFFYTKWINNSQYKALNLEYEYHTQKTVGKNPTLDIVFAIETK